MVTSLGFTVLINTVPAFASAPYSFSLSENSDGSTNPIDLGTLSATDADSADSLTWSLKTGDSGKFRVVANNPDRTAKLQYIGSGENRETTASPEPERRGRGRTLRRRRHGGGDGECDRCQREADRQRRQRPDRGPDQRRQPARHARRQGQHGSGGHSLTYTWTAPAGVTLQTGQHSAPLVQPAHRRRRLRFQPDRLRHPRRQQLPLNSTPDTVRVTVRARHALLQERQRHRHHQPKSVHQHGATATTNVGSPVLASDPNGGTIASYSLADTTASSGHAANFQVSSGGQISVASGKTLNTPDQLHRHPDSWQGLRRHSAQ